ncbi:MAG: hypothetical protein IMF10_01905, partial [Proteobacteria bacterium]|nr:hypothetical protein [Pseudomonadota bacterium]
LYVLYVLKTIDGSSFATDIAKELIRESSQKARSLRNRNYCFEWYGNGVGMNKLIHHSRLGERDDEKNFFRNASLLKMARGRISKLSGPEAGQIEFSSGLEAFFIRARGDKIGGYQRGRDENCAVQFYVGFSYDGLRAWEVRDV